MYFLFLADSCSPPKIAKALLAEEKEKDPKERLEKESVKNR